MTKANVYAFIEHNSGEPHDPAGNQLRSEWVKLNIELEMGESIRKFSLRAPDDEKGYGSWGSNNVVLSAESLNRIVGKTMTICDAMLTDKEQKEAFKQLLKDTIYGWHDEIFNRYQLDESKVK